MVNMRRSLILSALVIMAGCIHRKRIDPVPFVPMNTCVLVTIDGTMVSYPPIAGHCLFGKKPEGKD